mgnify:CR=1 FL=1|jgi:CDP-paratose 2-epimerase|tara:strand:- start:115 stop:1176 length:1062 start_codon:yes stop_codon:yes gene_type:complete
MILITGSTGLIGSVASEYFLLKGKKIFGVDNNLRKYFFGINGSNKWKEKKLKGYKNYYHSNVDLRNEKKVYDIFKKHGKKIKAIIHTAAQPSHDWAAKEPLTDFQVNANATLNLLEATRKYCPEVPFIFTSTNKVYGDTPNFLPFVEKKFRYELKNNHLYFKNGIDEKMSIDHSTHSLFGVSKTSADLLVQEYGKYFNLSTVCFRGGCLTGENHSGIKLHGFLSFLVKTIMSKKEYNIIGYKGKQVRDNIHSYDVVTAFDCFIKKPKRGANVYNLGGGRDNSCSIIEAIKKIENISNIKCKYKILKKNRIGDHIWWISDNSKFKKDFPNWSIKKSLEKSIESMVEFEITQPKK